MTKNYCSFSYYTGHNRMAGYYITMTRDTNLDLSINIYPNKFLNEPPIVYLAEYISGSYLIGDLLRSFKEVKEYARSRCKIHNKQILNLAKGANDA